jgi:VWFA-related protein
MAFSLAVGCFALPAQAAVPARLRSISVGVLTDQGAVPGSLAEGDLRVRSGASEVAVERVEPAEAGEWSVLVYVDAFASSPSELASLEAWAGLAGSLVDLGEVSFVVSDTLAEPWLEQSVEGDEVADALLEVSASSFSAPEMPPEALLSWRRGLLVDTLVRFDAVTPSPRALLIVGSVGRGGDEAEAARLAAAVASLDWVVLEVAGEGSTGEALLAEQSGGQAVSTPEDLREALAGLADRSLVSFRQPFGGRGLEPLHVEGSRPGWSVRATRWSAPVSSDDVVASRARWAVSEGATGDLELAAVAALDSGAQGEEELKIEVLAGLESAGGAGPQNSSSIRLSLVAERLDEVPLILHRMGGGRDLSSASAWLLQVRLPLLDDIGTVVAMVEDLASGAWGATEVEVEGDSIGLLGAGTVVESMDLRRRPDEDAAMEQAGVRADEDRLIRILPPREHTLEGAQTFRTIVLNEFIRRVVFYLDGVQVGDDERRPFSARIDLGRGGDPREIKVVGLDRAGRPLAEDRWMANQRHQRFSVDIVEVLGDAAAGEVEVRADISLPGGARLEKVEVFWNETLQATLSAAPFVARLDTSVRAGTDFVRVVATLEDGESLEDVELLGVPGIVEEVDVNLVEIFAVVVDDDGEPLRDLEQGEFKVKLRGEEVELTRFGLADDIPLDIGLVIDTSQSMGPLMQDTRVAAIRFLSELVSEEDRAFLVDFDTRPRLAQGLTRDLAALVGALGTLQAGGNTALYDSILFSMLNFDDAEDRRALVLLTDGDDYQSRFTERRAALQARSGGVPVYMLSLAGLDFLRPSVRKSDLEYVARMTGGRVFYVNSRDELGPTYARIGRELRSQYVLAFATLRELSDRDLEKIEVEVSRRGAGVRAVVAGRSVQTR